MTGPETLRLFHGTSTAGWETAHERGQLVPRDHRALAAEIAAEYAIDADTLWMHSWFEYVRCSRSHDRNVYLTDDADNACYYARCLNESTRDALKTAHRILNQPLIDEIDSLPAEMGKDRWAISESAFIAAWLTLHVDQQPLILSFDFPTALLTVPEGVQTRFESPADWWQIATRNGTRKLWEIAIPEQVPLDYLISVEPAAAHESAA